LYEIIETLKQSGVAIVYISHRMKELSRLADRVTVLRDGACISSLPKPEFTEEVVVRQMVGRDVDAFFKRMSRSTPGEMLVQLEDVSTLAGIANINLEVRRGEIVGLAGLVGSGRTEVARAIFGADSIVSGTVRFKGKKYSPSPVESVRRGIAFVPEDRKGQGLAIGRSIIDNLSLPSLPSLFPRGIMYKGAIAKLGAKVLSALRVAAQGGWQTAGKLSGGNQQKIVFGKWLPLECDLFIIDEPTRGIDVGAKAEILRIVEQLANEGKGILMISSELPEIIGICDKVYVLKSGSITGSLSRDNFSEEAILKMAIA
jgi:ribose transport system ATP-binding protein